MEWEDKHGSLQFRLPGSPFAFSAGKDSAIIGKIFAVRTFEELHALGYGLVCSADLSRDFDQSSWFFKRGQQDRPRQPVMCVAPGSSDKLHMVRGCDYLLATLKQSVQSTWEPGIQSERTEENCGEKVHDIKLRGTPWQSEGEESTMCRKLLLDIVSRLGAQHWRLLAATNLRGGTDALFFIYDSDHFCNERELAMLSLNRHDRLRLINFDHDVALAVKNAILRFHQTKDPEERDYYGAWEFKVKGHPFASSGAEAVAARQLICRVLEAIRNCGWECLMSIDLSRKTSDKSVLLFRRCESAALRFACVAFSDVDRIRLLNFPPMAAKAATAVLAAAYAPGITSENNDDPSCIDLTLGGTPWTQNSSFGLHARSMLLRLLAETARLGGWRLASSADVSAKYMHQENGPDYPVDVHSWFFEFQPGWQGGSLHQQQSKPMKYAELKVSDLESSNGLPPTYDQTIRNKR